MKRKPKAYKRSVRKKQVLKQLLIWHENGFAKEATSYRLAKALELEPQQYFRDLLNEMVSEGLLKVSERDQSGRYTTRFYSLAHDADIITSNVKRRIIVKQKGVLVGQLEMAL